MADFHPGRILAGDEDELKRSFARFHSQQINCDRSAPGTAPVPARMTTLGQEVSVTGPGTFFGRAVRTLTFCPTTREGWWFERTDRPDQLPIRVCTSNVWTTARNIVLRSGSPHNYMRMVEHIIALRLGLNVDNAVVRMDSGDPPLFDRGSLDLVDAFARAGIVEADSEARYWTVKEPVTMGGTRGSFLMLIPCESDRPRLEIDCAIDFRNAIGRQRLVTEVNEDTFRYGAEARTNTTVARMLFTKTIGKLFADVRNLGYTTHNILIAGRFGYFNKPKLMHEGKSLEAVWHRCMMDLVAALSLVEKGRFAGRVLSYKAGHTLDVMMLNRLYQNDLLAPV